MPTLEDILLNPELLDEDTLANPMVLNAISQLSGSKNMAQTSAPGGVIDPDITQAIAQNYAESMKRQQQDAERLKAMLLQQQMMESQKGVLGNLDLRPFAQALKQYGSTTAVVPTEGPEDTQDKMLKLQKAIQESEQGIGKQQLDYLRAMALSGQKATSADLAKQRLEFSKKRLGATQEQRTISRITGDKLLNDYVSRIASIDRANESLLKTDALTNASLDEYQQNLRSALTSIKGTSSAVERANTYINTAEQEVAKLRTYLTGDVHVLDKNDPSIKELLTHLNQLSRMGRQILEEQGNERLLTVSSTSAEGAKKGVKEMITAPKTEKAAAEDPMLKQIRESRAAIEKKMQELSPKK